MEQGIKGFGYYLRRCPRNKDKDLSEFGLFHKIIVTFLYIPFNKNNISAMFFSVLEDNAPLPPLTLIPKAFGTPLRLRGGWEELYNTSPIQNPCLSPHEESLLLLSAA